MTDTQTIAGAILGGLTAIAAAIRWSVGRLAKTQDRGIAALVETAKSNATLTAKFDAKFDALSGMLDRLATRLDSIITALFGAPSYDGRPEESQRHRTAPRARATARVPQVRPEPDDPAQR